MLVEVAGKLLPSTSAEYKAYRQASPLHHVSKDAPPFLLMHGDAYELVAFQHSEAMELALKEVGAIAKLLRIPGGGHGPDFPRAQNPPDYFAEMVRWFDRHLRGTN